MERLTIPLKGTRKRFDCGCYFDGAKWPNLCFNHALDAMERQYDAQRRKLQGRNAAPQARTF